MMHYVVCENSESAMKELCHLLFFLLQRYFLGVVEFDQILQDFSIYHFFCSCQNKLSEIPLYNNRKCDNLILQIL